MIARVAFKVLAPAPHTNGQPSGAARAAATRQVME
jgi:hypothetical protein